ncbi:MAG: hydrolase [Gammaproteobacteria bacterium]
METDEHQTEIETKKNEPNAAAEKQQKSLFKPAWWLPGSHMQTLWPTLCRRLIKDVKLKRERFELPDGDFVDLDWAGHGHGPVILVLHGLEGSVNSPYANGMLNAVQQQGWRGVLMHFRGCSGEDNRHPRTYHSGDTADLNAVITALQAREPGVPFAAVGFSMGGNVLLKWLGELGSKNPLKAAVAVSVPFELHKTSLRIQAGFSRVYQFYFMLGLRKKMRDKFKAKPAPFEVAALAKMQTIEEFDDKVTAPLHGFASADDYYTKASCRQFLHKIAVPTLLIQAKDDPFMTDDLLPDQDELSPEVILELTEKGGHVGFVSGAFPWRAEYWLEQRVPEFLEQFLT